jgi:hypothetical protein
MQWLWAVPDVGYEGCALKCKELGQVVQPA